MDTRDKPIVLPTMSVYVHRDEVPSSHMVGVGEWQGPFMVLEADPDREHLTVQMGTNTPIDVGYRNVRKTKTPDPTLQNSIGHAT